ncbi:GbsR/MarR family transcriptional regulator [Nostocoides australiense]
MTEASSGNETSGGGRDESRVTAFVETFGATLTAAGMQRLPARVIAVLLADDDGRMTSAEICEALHVSRAAVSGAITFLQAYGFVTKERERGTRRDVYVLHTDTWHDVTLQKAAVIGYLVDQLQRGAEAVGLETAAGRRLRYSADFYAFVTEEMDRIIANWEIRREQIRAQYLD